MGNEKTGESMKNFRNIVNDDALRAVNGGAYIDFERIRRIREAIDAGNENAAIGWHWGDDWSDDGYWH